MGSSEIIALLRDAQAIALNEFGITNILQPGIVKELIMAELLGHDLIPQKDMPDACDSDGHQYEYLASILRRNVRTNPGCSFQMDRVTRTNLARITRNEAFYFGVFESHLVVAEIWRVETATVLAEAKRQLEKSRNEICHVNFLLKWLRSNGTMQHSTNVNGI